MAQQHFFVTGAMGCIGAWVVRNLVQENSSVTVFDLSTDRHRLELIMTADELARVSFIQGDLTQTNTVRDALTDSEATHIIHLGALQVPFCKADPPVGAAVNVLGTVNMFEAAKAAGIRQLVYASSVGVYGSKDMYTENLVQHDTPLYPLNHYGVYKQANEGSARVYWRDDQIASIGFRPYTVYGPGRDQGMTSTPTQAMLAAARGEAYHISFGGSNGFQFVDDIAKLFIQAPDTLSKVQMYSIFVARLHTCQRSWQQFTQCCRMLKSPMSPTGCRSRTGRSTPNFDKPSARFPIHRLQSVLKKPFDISRPPSKAVFYHSQLKIQFPDALYQR